MENWMQYVLTNVKISLLEEPGKMGMGTHIQLAVTVLLQNHLHNPHMLSRVLCWEKECEKIFVTWSYLYSITKEN